MPMYLYKYDLYRSNNDDSYYVIMRKLWITNSNQSLVESPPQILTGDLSYEEACDLISELTKP